MSKSLKLPPVKNKAGEALTDVEVKELVHTPPPPLEFTIGELTFAAYVDPYKVTGAHNNHIEATRRKLFSQFVISDGTKEADLSKDALLARAESNKAFDAAAFEAAYIEFDTARAERAAAATIDWNYPAAIEVDVLNNNAALGESYIPVFDKWWQDFTNGSAATGTTTTANSATLTTTSSSQSAEAVEAAPSPPSGESKD